MLEYIKPKFVHVIEKGTVVKTGDYGLAKMIEEKGALKIINKKSEFKPQTEIGSRLWDLDKLSTDIYNQLLYENLNIRNRGELTSTVKTVLP